MTDLPPLTDDDLSLALDGEADADLLARIDADPDARARLADLRAAQEQLASSSIPALDGEVVDDLIATAIDTPVAPERRAARGQRRAAPWIVAAAVILLMAVGLSLVWAGRSDQQDQASATFNTVGDQIDKSTGGQAADSSFSESTGSASGGSATGEAGTGGHGAPTTVAAPLASTASALLYLGAYDSGADLRAATATSLQDASQKNGSQLQYDAGTGGDEEANRRGLSAQNPPTQERVDRCAEQLQVTLSMKKAPVQTGYATVAGKDVLVYEFATASAKDADRETTLVAAVGADACDEVVIFER